MRAASIWDLSKFSLLDMLRCSRGLRNIAATAQSVDEVAAAVVGYLYSQSADPATKEPQCALVRLYRTQAYRDLEPSAREFVRSRLESGALNPGTKVLTLIATVGAESRWCDRNQSVDHQAIPLPSVEIVEQAPMIAGLIRAMGLDLADVVTPPVSLMHDLQGKGYNVFHVERALGSSYIPAQDDFVKAYGIESVIGFGGLLPTGDLFAVVMFSRVRVAEEPAGRFRNVALDIKAIMHPFAMPPGRQSQVLNGPASAP